MIHYVYKIIDTTTNEYYFGSRSCNCKLDDDKYMGSMKVWNPSCINLIKEIINDKFLTRNEAIEYESNLIRLYINDSLNKNYHIPTSGFHTKGRIQTDLERKTRSKHRIKYELSKGSNNAMYNKTHSSHSIEKMKQIAKGRYSKEWFVDKYGESIGLLKYTEKGENQKNKCLSDKNGMFGKTHTHYSKLKISESKQKKVAKYNTKNEIIYIYSSITEAAQQNNISVSLISLVCDPKRINKTAGGFIWKFI